MEGIEIETFKSPKLEIIVDITDHDYKTIMNATMIHDLKLKEKKGNYFIIDNKKKMCLACNSKCGTSKVEMRGNDVVAFCDNSKEIYTLADACQDINVIENINLGRICQIIMTDLRKYVVDEDIGLRELILNVFRDSMKFKGNVFYMYNGTTKLWIVCKSIDYAANIIAAYLRDIFDKIILDISNALINLEGRDNQEAANYDLTLLKVMLSKFKITTKMKAAVKSVIEHAVKMDYPDGKPYLFPIAGKNVVNLKTGEIIPRDLTHSFTNESHHRYLGKDYPCPNMEKFMNSLFLSEDEVEYMQMTLGYFLSGDISGRCYYIFWGEGHNGKSVLIEKFLKKILGRFHITLMASALIGSNTSGATPELMPLIGSRVASISELGINEKLNVPKIKQLTGGDTFSARGIYKNAIEFTNNSKIVMVTNHPPNLELDKAIIERTRFIPFSKKFVTEKEYNNVKEEDRKFYGIKDDVFINDLSDNHMDEVFTYLVNGAIKYFSKKDIEIPKRFKAECSIFIEDNDVIQEFIDERCEVDINEKSSTKGMLVSYNSWAVMSGLQKLTSQTLKKQLLAKGFKYKKISSMFVMGLKLKIIVPDDDNMPQI